jgi:hypothetical protein|tara:strand:- start:606 stop:1001 length:396 start_codon:yes stop_codon:yes gene_type:complete
MSTLSVASIQSLSSSTVPLIKNSSGVEKGRYIKAFVRYNMQNNSIGSSFGISSMTDNGTGVCTANFTTAFADGDKYGASCLGNGNVANGAHTYPSTFFGGVLAGSFKIGFFRNENSNDRVDQARMFMMFTD